MREVEYSYMEKGQGRGKRKLIYIKNKETEEMEKSWEYRSIYDDSENYVSL